MASTYTTNLQLENPTPADPLTLNTWGGIENEGRDLVDSAVAGLLSKSVAGGSNVVLTTIQGSPDEERNSAFTFTGALTGDIYVLYPAGRTKTFTARNSTSGAHTLSIGVDNGGGLPVGTTVPVAQGSSVYLVSDGTDVTIGVSAATPAGNAGGDLGGTYPNPTVLSVANVNNGTLAVLHGGTGTTTGTGTGDNVLSDSPTFTGTVAFAALAGTGNISTSAGSISDLEGNVRAIPPNAQTGYTLQATDAGKFIDLTSGGATVPASVFSAGMAVSIYNDSTGTQTITQAGGVTLYLVGTATTGNRSLAQRGIATILCVASNTFVISGGGLS